MATQATDKAEIRFYDPQDCDVKIGALQQHGDRQAAVHCRVVEWTPERMVSLSYYDPGLVLPRHSHAAPDVARRAFDALTAAMPSAEWVG